MSRTLPAHSALIVRIVGTVAACLVLLWTATVQAQAGPGSQWTQTSLTAPAFQLYAPASGALFARTSDGLLRSNDAGDTWTSVTLPAWTPTVPGGGYPGQIVVDPTDHTTIYATSSQGLQKTDDDAASWRVVLPSDPEYPELAVIAVSAADPHIVYAAEHNRAMNRLRVRRSADGGATWETVSTREISVHVSCDWAVYLLQPHAADPNRVFMATFCPRSATSPDLEDSRDGGANWTRTYQSKLETPTRLVVGGTVPGAALFVTLSKDPRGGGSVLLRSVDDGASWARLVEFTGGGGMTGGGPNVGIGGLAVDPIRPGRLLLGINASQGPQRLDSQIRLSTDTGESWSDIAPAGFPTIADLAFGIDGKTIYAATSTGVWRATAP
jgi:photosystem II stability/assembly factor-like uncharacterized protein